MKNRNDFGIEINTHVNGKGEILTTCPKCSPTRKKKKAKCLSVNIEKNVWHCNHCDWSGTLNQGEQKTSRPYYEEKPKIYLKPTPKTNINPSQEIIDWFARRKISEDTLIKMKVTNGLNWMPAVEDYVNTIEFNYFKNGELVNIKYRDKNKNFKQHRDAEKIFYNIDGIEDQREIIIVEGEIDVLSFIEAGIDNVISVPDGAPAIGTKNFSSKFDYLENYKGLFENIGLVVLACDNDGPGMLLTDELARRIGKEKCYLVKWPEGCKDANDVLVKYSKEKLMSCITSMYPYPINGIIEVNQLHENIYNIYEHGFKRGLSTGWSCLNKFYTVRPGELTIVSGIPSHGKSEMLDALTINLARNEGWRFGMFSPENYPVERHIVKLVEKYTGYPFRPGMTERISKECLNDALDWIDEHYYFMSPEEDQLVKIDKILELSRVLIYRKGINGIVIDPWNEIDHSRPNYQTETEYVSDCLSRIRRFSRTNDVHIWLVAHPTKLHKRDDGKEPVPTAYDISGSSHFRNKADNCITVYRDLINNTSNVEIHIQKVRFKEVGEIGLANLIYNKINGCYRE